MTTTPDDLFYSAYAYAGLIQIEQMLLAPNQTEDARKIYNEMVDAFNANGLTVSHIARTLFDVNPSQGDYTIGPNGDWPTPMYQRGIERMSVVLTAQSPNPEYPLFPLTIDDWQEWRLKGQINNWARSFYYEPAGPPLGIVHLLYVPTDINKVAIYLEDLHVPIDATGDQEIEFQYGFQEMVTTNLAVRIAARHPKDAQISEDTRRLAKSSLELIENNNSRPLKRTTDLNAGRSRTNVYTGSRYR